MWPNRDQAILASGQRLRSAWNLVDVYAATIPTFKFVPGVHVSGFVGVLGPMGHHALLLGRTGSADPDGLANLFTR